MKKAKASEIYQLKITLKYSHPPIWRRVQVPGDMTLGKLHGVIQAAMGWYDSHLHQFIVGKAYYGLPSFDEVSELELNDERKVGLSKVLSKSKQKIVYEYDFGDSWQHEILLEKIVPPDSKTRYPICLGGARACPPEDCGGIGGYASFLQAISDPGHEEHKETLEWVGGEFDPEAFDLEAANRALKRIR
ncbi:MAG: plasmid pRiA4b ORF-3 family protein [Deltaproteobacteria bacterium]|nr:plasmid pRiA4b ORF-3 family protein [Deltaproteobacteria bacterium]